MPLIDIDEFNSIIRDNELANLVRVRHAARFENEQTAISLAAAFEIAQQQPAIHKRRNPYSRLFGRVRRLGEAGEQRSDLLGFEVIYQPGQHRSRLHWCSYDRQVRDGIQHDYTW